MLTLEKNALLRQIYKVSYLISFPSQSNEHAFLSGSNNSKQTEDFKFMI